MSVALLGAAALGVAAHLLYFHRGEHHLHGLRYVQALILAAITSTFVLTHYGEQDVRESIRLTATLLSCFLGGLFTSLIIYRLFFNPLNKYPGPFWARLTGLYFTVAVRKLDANQLLYELHQKHGKFVRYAPNDLSVTEPEATQAVLGLLSKCKKAPWYDGDVPYLSMHTTRDKTMHDRRRRIWSPAFSDKALRGYEERVKKYNDLILEQLSSFAGQPFDASKWFNLYSFDVMGDLAFGKSFNMLESGKTHWVIQLLNEGMEPVGFNFPIWFVRVLISIPGALEGYMKFIRFCCEQLDERMKIDQMDTPDIMATLLEHHRKNPEAATELPLLQGDSRLIIVAGSDTTAATLVHLFYHLADDPSLVQKLRKELTPLLEEDGTAVHSKIADAPFLNGVINETLRLHPPVPSGVFRMAPPEGMTVKDTFIPGETVIRMPGYAMGRDEDIYQDCHAFIPERWYSQLELIKHKEGFTPFSIGPFGCIGKNLALMEIRLLVTQLVMALDVAFAPGEDGKTLLYKTHDHFTLGLGELKLVMNKRKGQ